MDTFVMLLLATLYGQEPDERQDKTVDEMQTKGANQGGPKPGEAENGVGKVPGGEASNKKRDSGEKNNNERDSNKKKNGDKKDADDKKNAADKRGHDQNPRGRKGDGAGSEKLHPRQSRRRQNVAEPTAPSRDKSWLLLFIAGFGAGFVTRTLGDRWREVWRDPAFELVDHGPWPTPSRLPRRPKPDAVSVKPAVTPPKTVEPAPRSMVVPPLRVAGPIVYDSLTHIDGPRSKSASEWIKLPEEARVGVNERVPYGTFHRCSQHDLAGVSLRGPGHFKAEMPCQDAHRSVALADGTIIVAVADGVGSADHSDVGARVAVDAAIDFLVRALARPTGDGEALMRATLETARARVSSFADEARVTTNQLASTLLVAVVQGRTLYTAHAGDGAIVKLSDGSWTIASPPEDTMYANYVTPVACKSASDKWQVHVHTEVDAVALLSDGLERSAVKRSKSSYEVNSQLFGPIHDALIEVEDPVQGAGLIDNTLNGLALRAASDDDKTLVMVWTRNTNLNTRE